MSSLIVAQVAVVAQFESAGDTITSLTASAAAQLGPIVVGVATVAALVALLRVCLRCASGSVAPEVVWDAIKTPMLVAGAAAAAPALIAWSGAVLGGLVAGL